MSVYIITACHNRISTTKKLIESLKKQSYQDFRLIVVDDGCIDGTIPMIHDLMANVIVIKGNGKLWWGGALHKAYKWLCNNVDENSDIVFFTNDDNIYENRYLEKAVIYIENNKNTIITGNGFSLQTGKQVDGVSFCNLKTGVITLLGNNSVGNLASTRSLFMRIEDLKTIGGFHPKLLPHYLSDYEFVLRASKKGFIIKTYKDLNYTYDRSLTGIKDFKKLTLRLLFSKRCPYNPLYKFNYLMLVTPIKYIPARLFNQLKNYCAHKTLLDDKNIF